MLKPLELAYSPGSHTVQDVDSELAEYVPGTHCVHEADPVDGAEDPAGQMAQSAAPSVPSVEVPSGQFPHTLGRVAPTVEEYLPRPHSKHSEPGAGLYVPIGQSEHWPGEEAPVEMVEVPTGHGAHDTFDETEEYLPRAQDSQDRPSSEGPKPARQ